MSKKLAKGITIFVIWIIFISILCALPLLGYLYVFPFLIEMIIGEPISFLTKLLSLVGFILYICICISCILTMYIWTKYIIVEYILYSLVKWSKKRSAISEKERIEKSIQNALRKAQENKNE